MMIISQTRRIINFPQISRLSCQSAECNFDLTGSIGQINRHNNLDKTNNSFLKSRCRSFVPCLPPDKTGFLLKLSRPAAAALARTPLMPVRTRIDSQSLNWTTRYRGICRHGTSYRGRTVRNGAIVPSCDSRTLFLRDFSRR